ncbi:MAG: DUF2807 domain-containing protein [Flavobacteriales bacterium]
MILSFASCTKESAPDCISALGHLKTELREIDSFDRIEIQGRMNVNLTQDSSDWIEVTFGEGLLDGVITKSENKVLSITESNHCDWVRDQTVLPLVTVHYRSFRNIFSECAGTVNFTNPHRSGRLVVEISDVSGYLNVDFIGDSIDIVSHTGSTDISAKGTTNVAYFYSSSYAPIRADSLVSRVAIPHSELTGDIELRAWEAVYYQIFDDGNIIVHGHPDLIKKWHHDGAGEVILADD